MLDNPNMNCNNNFDGVLDADSCSFDSFSQDDSEIDTFSEGDFLESSDEEMTDAQPTNILGWTGRVGGEEVTTVETFKTETSKQLKAGIHQQIITDDIIMERSRSRARVAAAAVVEAQEQQEEQEEVFKFKEDKKSKPKLPEAGLLQSLALLNSSDSSSHCWSDDCDDVHCPVGGMGGMYSYAEYESHNSF